METLRIALLGLSLLSLNACSKVFDKFSRIPAGSTAVRFVTQGQAGMAPAALEGGIMVYAIRTTDQFRKSTFVPNSTSNPPEPFVLPNGSYNFVAVGWSSSGMVGAPKCGFDTIVDPINLAGQDTTVTLSLNAASCGADYFAKNNEFGSSGSIENLNLYFCDGAVDLNPLSNSDTCGNGKESSRFFKGYTSANPGIGRVQIDSHTNRMVYVAEKHNLGTKELFSSDLNGTVVRQSGIPTSLGTFDVEDFEVIPNTGKVVFLATTDATPTRELFLSTLGTAGATKISGGTFNGANGVTDFSLAGTSHVIFSGEMDANDGKVSLYSISLSDLAITKLSASTPSGAGVTPYPSSTDMYLFKITSDGTKVAFAGAFDNATRNDIYVANVNGAANSAVKVSDNAPHAAFTVRDIFVTNNNSSIVWLGDYLTAGKYELFMHSISAANAAPTKVSQSDNNGVSGRVYFSKTGAVVAYAQDADIINRNDLYTASIGLTSFENITRVHSTPTPSSEYVHLKFNNENSKIVYYSDQGTDNIYNLYSATVGSLNSAIVRNHSTYENPTITQSSGDKKFKITPENYVFYLAQDTGDSDTVEDLFKFDLANNSLGTLFSLARNSTKTVRDFSYGDSNIFYLYNSAGTTAYDLFMRPANAVAAESQITLPGPNAPTNLNEVHFIKSPENLSGYPKALAITASALGASNVPDLYGFLDYTSPNALKKFTRMYDHTNGSGRFKFTLLKYESSPSGDLLNSNDGISSLCMHGPAGDGTVLNIGSFFNVYFPAGSGTGTSPFALALDVYSGAVDCSGASQRILFPQGLSNHSLASPSGKLKFVELGGTQPTFFVKD